MQYYEYYDTVDDNLLLDAWSRDRVFLANSYLLHLFDSLLLC